MLKKRSFGGAPFQLKHCGLDRFNSIRSLGPTIILNLDQIGTLTRASSGSYQTSAPTDGSTPFVAWAGPNQKRFEDKNDGFGPRLLLEGFRANLINQSRTLTGSAWNVNGTRTGSVANGPDGYLSGTRVITLNTAANWGILFAAGNAFTAEPYALSAYVRSFTGTQPYSFALSNGAVNQCYNGITGTADTTWRRVACAETIAAAGTYYANFNSAIGLAKLGTIGVEVGVLARDAVADLLQVETGSFASSPIESFATNGTRAADIFSVPPAQIPTAVGSGSFYFDIWPTFGSSQSTGSFTLLSFGPIDYISISGNTFRLSASRGVSSEVASNAVSWNPNQRLRIVVSNTEGYFEISGANSGNGRFWTPLDAPFGFLTSSTMVIGSTSGTNVNPYFGRISDFYLTGANAILVDMLLDGEFTRSSSGSHYLGSTSSIVFRGPNVRRIEDKGDGYGSVYKTEGSRTNVLGRSRGVLTLAGDSPNAAISNSAIAPDGLMVAVQQTVPTTKFGMYETFATTSGSYYASSMMVKPNILTWFQHKLYDSPINFSATISGNLSNQWERRSTFIKPSASVSVYVPAYSHAVYGGSADPQDNFYDMHQVEQATFASSFISSSTRAADILRIPTGSIPGSILSGGAYEFDIYPDFLPQHMHSGGQGQYLFAFRHGVYSQACLLSYANPSSPANIYIFHSGVAAPGGNFSWTSLGQKIRITLKPSEGWVEISGATIGNGKTLITPWTWLPALDYMQIGSNTGGEQPFFGRISNFYVSGSRGY